VTELYCTIYCVDEGLRRRESEVHALESSVTMLARLNATCGGIRALLALRFVDSTLVRWTDTSGRTCRVSLAFSSLRLCGGGTALYRTDRSNVFAIGAAL
jgi:hypothetical protein